jgi:hypothetical protein
VFNAAFANVSLEFEPSVVMAAMHTTIIRANITAYSTAVGPSSETRKRLTFKEKDFIGLLLRRGGPASSRRDLVLGRETVSIQKDKKAPGEASCFAGDHD